MTAPKRNVVRMSLGDQVTESVRDMILTGELGPGDRITHDGLAKTMSVSAMPVREALVRLTQEGFLEARPNRSFQVARTTRDDIRDLYWTHGLMTGELAARACRLGDAEFITELRGIQDAWQRMDPADIATAVELNCGFHRAITRAAGSPKIIKLVQNTIRFVPERYYALLPTWKEVAYRGRLSIIKAIEAGDEHAARAAAEEHVHEAGSLLMEYFDDNGFWAEPAPHGGPGARRRTS